MTTKKTLTQQLDKAWRNLQFWVDEYMTVEETYKEHPDWTPTERNNYKENTWLYAYMEAESVERLVRDLERVRIEELTANIEKLKLKLETAQRELADIVYDTSANSVFAWTSRDSPIYYNAKKALRGD